jgi:hypothetical protein
VCLALLLLGLRAFCGQARVGGRLRVLGRLVDRVAARAADEPAADNQRDGDDRDDHNGVNRVCIHNPSVKSATDSAANPRESEICWKTKRVAVYIYADFQRA